MGVGLKGGLVMENILLLENFKTEGNQIDSKNTHNYNTYLEIKTEKSKKKFEKEYIKAYMELLSEMIN